MSQIKSLCDLKRDHKARIVSMNLAPEDSQRLMRAGVLPHSQIKVVSNNRQDVLFVADRSVLALDRVTASGIFVELV